MALADLSLDSADAQSPGMPCWEAVELVFVLVPLERLRGDGIDGVQLTDLNVCHRGYNLLLSRLFQECDEMP